MIPPSVADCVKGGLPSRIVWLNSAGAELRGHVCSGSRRVGQNLVKLMIILKMRPLHYVNVLSDM